MDSKKQKVGVGEVRGKEGGGRSKTTHGGGVQNNRTRRDSVKM